MLKIRPRACNQPLQAAEFFRFFPTGYGPNILGMCGTRPGYPAQLTGIARDRRRRVQKMSVKQFDVGGNFAGKHGRLNKASGTISRPVSFEVLPPTAQAGSKRTPPQTIEKRLNAADGFFMDIFRKV